MSVNLHLPRLRGHGRHHPAEILRRLTGERDRALAAVGKLRGDLAEANVQRDAAHAKSSRLAEVEADNERLRTENTALHSALANATSVSVAAWVRIDNDPVDETGQVWADPTRWKAPDGQHHVVPLADAVDGTGEIPRPRAA